MDTKNNPAGLNRKAYLGKLALDLVHLSSEQVLAVYAERGLLIPVEASSTLSYLNQHDNSALSNIGAALEIPHQLAAQRVSKLMQLGLLKKRPDKNDGRRSVLELSKLGKQQAEILLQCMEDMAVIYEQIYREIECDLPAKLQSAIDALKNKNLLTRFTENF